MAFINLLIPSAAGGPFTVGGYWLLRFPAVLFFYSYRNMFWPNWWTMSYVS
jgi:hypothetical protein